MKWFTLVLFLFALISTGFAVNGKVYTRLLADMNGGKGLPAQMGYYDSEPWVQWGYTPLADLSCGRQGTGVDISFDNFTLSYKLRRPFMFAENYSSQFGFRDIYSHFSALGQVSANTNAVNIRATSPGYLSISGLKLGGIDFAFGGAWWTYSDTADAFDTNAAGVTNTFLKGKADYNLFAFDMYYNIRLGDIRFHTDPWNRVNFCFYLGSDNVNNLVKTNTGAENGWGAGIPLSIDFSTEAFSVTADIKAFISGNSKFFIDGQGAGVDATNTSSSFTYETGGVLKLNYIINETFGIFGDIGLVAGGSTSASCTNMPYTNFVDSSSLSMPLMGGITIILTSALTFNLGLGYQLYLSDSTFDRTVDASGTVTTNSATGKGNESRFQSEWDKYGIHGYHHPFVKFGADTQFATDWSAGLRFIIMLNDVGADGYPAISGTGANNGYLSQNSHTLTGHTYYNNWLNFQTIPDWDGLGGSSAYLGYSKDNFTAKLWVAANNQGGSGDLAGNRLLSLFSAIDIDIKF